MHTMKRLVFAVTLIAGLVVALPAAAQVSIDNTTTSAAISPTDTQITLGSVTCTGCTFTAGTTIYIDTEQMIVAGSYVSGTTVPVVRTRAAAHVSGSRVYLGPANRFHRDDPPVGACNKVVQSNGFYPWINILTGGEWICDNGQNAYTTIQWRVLWPWQIGTVAASR